MDGLSRGRGCFFRPGRPGPAALPWVRAGPMRRNCSWIKCGGRAGL